MSTDEEIIRAMSRVIDKLSAERVRLRCALVDVKRAKDLGQAKNIANDALRVK